MARNHPHQGKPKSTSRESDTDKLKADRPADFAKVGPTSIEGVEASDLPDKGRGSVDTDAGKELRRRLPQQTGAVEDGDDVGMRGTPPDADVKNRGRRGKN